MDGREGRRALVSYEGEMDHRDEDLQQQHLSNTWFIIMT